MTEKLGPKLIEQLRCAKASELVDVVLELHSPSDALESASGAQSRAAKITAMKDAFSRRVAGLEDALQRVGGEITDQAWINQTVRGRVPADRLEQLSQHDSIVAMDCPRRLELDSS